MKKKITCSLLVLLLFALTLLSFVGCERVDSLTTSQIFEIRKTYASSNGKFDLKKFFETKVLKYLGTYDGNIAVKIYYASLLKLEVWPDPDSVIDGVQIGDLDTDEIFVLYILPKNGEEAKVYPLSYAYKEGYVTKSDLEKIAEIEQGTAKK